jgi:hypothetical protein
MLGVATPTKEAIYTKGDPGDAIGEKEGKPKMSVAMPITATSPQDTISAQTGKGMSDTK